MWYLLNMIKYFMIYIECDIMYFYILCHINKKSICDIIIFIKTINYYAYILNYDII